MSHYFFDSSALAKRYIPEAGTNWIRSIVSLNAGNNIIVASITRVEIISAVMRRARETSISVRTSQAVHLLVNRHSQRQYHIIGLTETIVLNAQNLLEVHPLRAYDAVQLASALEVNQRLSVAGFNPITFLSADTRLLSIATLTGLLVDNPNNYP